MPFVVISCQQNFFTKKYNNIVAIYKEEVLTTNVCNHYYIFRKPHQYEVVNCFDGILYGKWTYINDTLCVYSPTYYTQEMNSEKDSLLIKKRDKFGLYTYRKFVIKGKYLKECTDYTDFLKYDSEVDSIQHYQQDLIDAHYLNEHVKKYNYMTRIRQ